MKLPSVVQTFKNQLRSVVPVVPEKEPPPCILSTQPACLALAMTLLAQNESQVSTSEGHTRRFVASGLIIDGGLRVGAQYFETDCLFSQGRQRTTHT